MRFNHLNEYIFLIKNFDIIDINLKPIWVFNISFSSNESISIVIDLILMNTYIAHEIFLNTLTDKKIFNGVNMLQYSGFVSTH